MLVWACARVSVYVRLCVLCVHYACAVRVCACLYVCCEHVYVHVRACVRESEYMYACVCLCANARVWMCIRVSKWLHLCVYV